MNLPYLGIPVIGVIDLLLEDENGNLIISDYKVTKKAWSASQIDENFQLSIYQLALKKMGLSKPGCNAETGMPDQKQEAEISAVLYGKIMAEYSAGRNYYQGCLERNSEGSIYSQSW